MPWLAVDLALPIDPRTLHLCELMGWSPDETVGRLLRFWGWCLNFAPDGDLTKFPPERIAQGIGLPGSDGERLRSALLKSGWVEASPHLRVHDWWGIAGMFLKGRLSRTPRVWRRIQALYTPRKRGSSGGRTQRKPGSGQSRNRSGAAHEQLRSNPPPPPVQTSCVTSPDRISTGPAPEPLQSSSCSAHDQVCSSSESAPLQVVISPFPFSPPVRTRSESDCDLIRIREEKRRDTETKENPPPPPFPPPAEGDEGREEDLSGNLRNEVLQRTALRRLSPADEKELSRLAQAHGVRAIEACQHLHSGIKNATGYLKVILEGKQGPDAELERFKRLVHARGLG